MKYYKEECADGSSIYHLQVVTSSNLYIDYAFVVYRSSKGWLISMYQPADVLHTYNKLYGVYKDKEIAEEVCRTVMDMVTCIGEETCKITKMPKRERFRER